MDYNNFNQGNVQNPMPTPTPVKRNPAGILGFNILILIGYFLLCLASLKVGNDEFGVMFIWIYPVHALILFVLGVINFIKGRKSVEFYAKGAVYIFSACAILLIGFGACLGTISGVFGRVSGLF